MNVRTKGLVCGAVAAATYGMNPLFTLPLYHAGMTPDSVLFYRYAFALPILAAMIRLRGQDFSLRRCEMLPLVAMGLLFSASSLFLYMSYNYMDAGIASTILFVYPILVALIMALGFRERITPLTIFCIALAVLGIGLLYEGDGQTLSLTGVTLVLLSSLSSAVYIVGVNRSALAALPTVKLTFFALLFGLAIYVVRLDFLTGLQAVPSWYLWGNVLALAALPTAVSLLCTTQAIHYIGSTPTAILGALEPVTAVFFGVVIFHEELTARLGLGIALLCMYKSSYTQSFILALTMLPAVVQVIIMLVNGSIGAGVAVAGTFSLVRFRSVPGTGREIGMIFLVMAVGLATGMGYAALAVLFFGAMAAFILTLSAFRFGGGDKGERELKITIPEDLDYTGVFEDLLKQYASSWELIQVKTTNMGSLFRLTYNLTLYTPNSEKKLIDQLRCRNGNLEITVSKQETTVYEL